MRKAIAALLAGGVWLLPAGVHAAPAAPCTMMVFNPDSSVILNGSPTGLASLPARLTALARRKPPPVLCLVASQQSNYAEVQAALDAIRKSGLTVNLSAMQARP